MKLFLDFINIRDVRFDLKNRIENATLLFSKKHLTRQLCAMDPRLNSVHIDIAKPGQSVRIVPVKDVIEPRIDLSTGSSFPGILTPLQKPRGGVIKVLKGTSVITCGQIIAAQEGIIDMSGPGARYSLFSKLINIVVTAEVTEGLEKHQHEEALRLLGLRAAAYIGEIAKNTEVDESKRFDMLDPKKNQQTNLRKIVYICPILSQGLLHDTYIYGVNSQKMEPIFIQPTEIMKGAIVSGNCVSACDKATTFHHQNNAIIRELYRVHGKEINFCAVILVPLRTSQAEKNLCAQKTGDLVASIRPDGAIISKEGFGNPDADFMAIISKLEANGVKTVGITDEFAGRDGASQSLADAHPSANAIVSTGNANQLILLPPMKRTIGETAALANLAGAHATSIRPDGSIEIELQAIIGATNQIGFERLSAKEE